MHSVEAFFYARDQVGHIVDLSKTDTTKMDVSAVTDLIRKLPKQQEMMKGYKIHLALLDKVTARL
jgi:hypothetical protein